MLRQKHDEIPKDIEKEIPDIQMHGKVVRGDDAESDRELKFHKVQIPTGDGEFVETDTMVTVVRHRKRTGVVSGLPTLPSLMAFGSICAGSVPVSSARGDLPPTELPV